MTAPAELAARHTELKAEAFAHLQRLMGSWGVLSDLSFSDLLLLAPLRSASEVTQDTRTEVIGSSRAAEHPGEAGEVPNRPLVVLGQIRPTTGATLIRVDLVGHLVDSSDWPGVEETLRNAHTVLGSISISKVLPPPPPAPSPPSGPGDGAQAMRRDWNTTGEVPVVEDTAQLECLPVPFAGEVSAVLLRVGPVAERRSGRLERIYRDLYHRLSAMLVAGDFPQAGEEVVSEDAPRVGDGLLVTDAQGRITYSSPNAMSALHRMGVSQAVEGNRLSEAGVEDAAIATALATGRPVIEEVERRPDVIVLVHCTPLLDNAAVTGSMVLLRDVTDLRRLDRLLLSKDAAIREVHHRVKNNLQTISSLLRLQARRLDPGKGREALREAERRVRSIAVVHEILSRDPGDQVSFREILDALVRMTEDSVVSGRRVEISVSGDAGDLSADMATPLAVALAEILQNAVEHAFSDGPEAHKADLAKQAKGPAGNVWMFVKNDGAQLVVQVRDDGHGLPEGFDIDSTTSLGLSIVRDLVRSQLDGTISMENARGESGTLVTIEVPVAGPSELVW